MTAGKTAAWVIAVLALASCARRESPSTGEAPDHAASVQRLAPGRLDALRDSFNAAVDRPRILLLLSPT